MCCCYAGVFSRVSRYRSCVFIGLRDWTVIFALTFNFIRNASHTLFLFFKGIIMTAGLQNPRFRETNSLETLFIEFITSISFSKESTFSKRFQSYFSYRRNTISSQSILIQIYCENENKYQSKIQCRVQSWLKCQSKLSTKIENLTQKKVSKRQFAIRFKQKPKQPKNFQQRTFYFESTTLQINNQTVSHNLKSIDLRLKYKSIIFRSNEQQLGALNPIASPSSNFWQSYQLFSFSSFSKQICHRRYLLLSCATSQYQYRSWGNHSSCWTLCSTCRDTGY